MKYKSSSRDVQIKKIKTCKLFYTNMQTIVTMLLSSWYQCWYHAGCVGTACSQLLRQLANVTPYVKVSLNFHFKYIWHEIFLFPCWKDLLKLYNNFLILQFFISYLKYFSFLNFSLRPMSPRLTLLYLVIQAEDNAQMNMRVTIRASFTHIQLTLGCFNYLTAAIIWILQKSLRIMTSHCLQWKIQTN